MRDPTAGVLQLELAEKEVPESIGAWDASSPSAACEGVQRDPSRTKLGQRLHLCPINLSCGKLKKKKRAEHFHLIAVNFIQKHEPGQIIQPFQCQWCVIPQLGRINVTSKVFID